MLVAAYARFSSDNQREESIDAQLRAIWDWADKNGHSIIATYADAAKSATTDNRPQFRQMIEDAAQGRFEAVVVHKLDRFSRDRYDSAFYKRQLRRHGVRLISVLENLDSSPESIILESVLEGMAEYYSKNLAREVMKGMKENALQCKHTGGTPPLGYDVTPEGYYTVNEREAEAVRLIFTMYAEGHGYSAILDALAEGGYRTKRNAPFGKNSLHEILKNEKYIGNYVFNRTKSKSESGTRNNHASKDEDEIIRVTGGMPRIIDDELWARVQERMILNRRRSAAYKAKTVYLLSGLIHCGCCGAAMFGNTIRKRDRKTYSYYECCTKKNLRTCSMKRLSRAVADMAVLLTLENDVFSKDASKNVAIHLREYAMEQKKKAPSAIREKKKRLSAVERELKNYVDAIGSGLYTREIGEKIRMLDAERTALQDDLSYYQAAGEAAKMSVSDAAAYLNSFSGIINMAPKKQQTACHMFVERVIVYEDRLDIIVTPWTGKSVKRSHFWENADAPSGSDKHMGLDTLVEARGIEPLSENPSDGLSPSAAVVLHFPQGTARRRAEPLGSFMLQAPPQSFGGLVPHGDDARDRIVGPPVRTAAVTQREPVRCWRLCLSSRLLRSSGLRLAYPSSVIPVETSTPP